MKAIGSPRPPAPLDIRPIEARANAASAGRWQVLSWKSPNPTADIALVEHAREDLIALIQEVKRLRAELDAERALKRSVDAKEET